MQYRWLVTGLFASLLAGNAMAYSQLMPKSQLVEMMSSSQHAQCNNDEYVSCLGISQATCHRYAKAIRKECVAPLPDPLDPEKIVPQLNKCADDFLASNKLPKEKVKACSLKVFGEEY